MTRQIRIKGKGGPCGKRTNIRVVPMWSGVRTLREHHGPLEKACPIKVQRAQDLVKAIADGEGEPPGT